MYALADCNNFFASCERVFRPDLNGKPVIVLSNNDGCAVARSNEAKALGIKMGDPYFKIRDIIERNHVAVFSSNFALYGDMSRRVQEVLRSFAPAVEQYSIDEAFLDLTGMENVDFAAFAREVSRACWKYTSIPVSVGVAKFPAKDVWGIGRRSVKKLESMGVKTAWDYTQLPETTVRKLFALPGFRTWKELKGVPCVEFEDMVEPKQSICVSRSFAHEITTLPELTEQVATFAVSAVAKLRKQGSLAQELTVFAMTNRFKDDAPQTSGGVCMPFPDATADHRTVVLRRLFRPGFGYKKAGVVFTRIVQAADHTRSLFEDEAAAGKEARLSETLDTITRAFGPGAVLFGAQGDGTIRNAREHQSPHYTTLWSDIPGVKVE